MPQPTPPSARPAPAPIKGGAAKSPSGATGTTTRGAASIELAPGDLFAGRYRIDKQVGRGGMGAVYLAEQEPLARKVAIKVLHGTADETTVARFQREARLIAQLQHPHIVGLIDFGEDDGRLYLVMEYIDGEPLTALLKREAPLAPKRACEIALQVTEALSVAHDIQVVHRDVKPDNVMILRTAGGQDFVKMLDFGVAKIKREGDQQNTIETKAGLIVGSLRYISPEQVESGDISPRTDIYSFGCILYEMLTGRRVFDHPSPADCAIAHLTERPKPPTVGGHPLTGPLVDLVMRCLEKKPGKRPADAREALKILMACRADPARVEVPVEPDEEHTVHQLAGGLSSAQGAATVELSAIVPPTSRPQPRPATDTGQRAMPDAQLRRSTGAHEFTAGMGEGPTSTHVRGIQLDIPRRGKAWLWIALVVVLAGGGAAAALLLTDGSSPTPAPETATATSDKADVASSIVDTTAPEPIDAPPPTPEDVAEVSPEVAEVVAVIEGTHIITNPTGAEVRREKDVVCKTPCTLPWRIDEKPPLVRLKLEGHIDIDLQLVRGDHGTEQRFELRPSTP